MLNKCLAIARQSLEINQKHQFLLTFHPLLIGGDGCTLDSNVVLLNGESRVDCHLIVGLITVWQTQVIIQAFNLQVWEDQLKFKKENKNLDKIHQYIFVKKNKGINFEGPYMQAVGFVPMQSSYTCMKTF